MSDNNETTNNFSIVTAILDMLHGLEREEITHVLATVQTWLRISPAALQDTEGGVGRLVSERSSVSQIGEQAATDAPFSAREDVSPKEFLLQKQPVTDVERVVCLAYYLTHYRLTPHFKTVDLSKLNTEAAHRKLSNPPQSAKDAVKAGFLVPAPKQGQRQIGAMGERYVQELPDRAAAKTVRRRMMPRKKTRASSSKGSGTKTKDQQ